MRLNLNTVKGLLKEVSLVPYVSVTSTATSVHIYLALRIDAKRMLVVNSTRSMSLNRMRTVIASSPVHALKSSLRLARYPPARYRALPEVNQRKRTPPNDIRYSMTGSSLPIHSRI